MADNEGFCPNDVSDGTRVDQFPTGLQPTTQQSILC